MVTYVMGISDKFSKSNFVGKPEPDRLLNYVWINKEKFEPCAERPTCGVPLHYIDKAVHNALLYSDIQVDIWLDFNLLDKQSIETVRDHVSKVKNIKIRNLQDIESYQKSNLFDPDRSLPEGFSYKGDDEGERQSIWGRVDLARLMVIRHCLENTAAKDIFYSDFDADDTKLNSPRVSYNLKKFGMVFGSSKRNIIENGYMGFRRTNMDGNFFDTLLDSTERYVAEGYNGYGPFYQQLKKWAEQNDVKKFPNDICFKVLRTMRYKIPENATPVLASLS